MVSSQRVDGIILAAFKKRYTNRCLSLRRPFTFNLPSSVSPLIWRLLPSHFQYPDGFRLAHQFLTDLIRLERVCAINTGHPVQLERPSGLFLRLGEINQASLGLVIPGFQAGRAYSHWSSLALALKLLRYRQYPSP